MASKKGPFPLLPLPKDYYNPKDDKARRWSPWHLPSRKKNAWIGILFDWLLLIGMSALSQWFFIGPQPPIAYFNINDESLKHPIVDEIISANNATIINTVIPAIVMIIFDLLFFWNVWDFYHMITGHVASVAISLFFTSLGWVTIGGNLGLRPNFLTKCKPNMMQVTSNITYYTNEICTEILSKFEYQGFPSGHSSTAFAGWVYFVMYINGKSKPWTGGAHLWKVLILILPLYFASWISLTRVNDYRHFPFQIIVGGLIGILSGLIAYRLHFVVNGWFLGSSDGLDHIPGHYRYIEDWEDEKGSGSGVNSNSSGTMSNV